jgi:glycosidase
MRRVITVLVALLVLANGRAGAQPDDAWQDGVCYEVFVRSFADSDGDGVGDLAGLTARLDYINDGDAASDTDLGANCIWLMPVAQSPSYHGYDVTNYYDIERDYGTKEDFRTFVNEAHGRGIRIIIDMVLNHSSSEHPFFKAALVDRDSPYRDWYTWSPTERPMAGYEAPTWHRASTRDEYYYGLFWSGMPDLELADPEVRAETRRIARFWLEDMAVDGFRLDAVAHFFEDRDRWRHVEAVHPWLRDYAADLRRMSPGVFTVGEVWDSIGAILPYYPGQLDAYFMFEVADAIVEAARSGTGQTLVRVVERLQRDIPSGLWGSFLRNHDQTRTMTELNGDVARAKLAASLLLTLPGIPFIYYGEEIGMTGTKADGDPRLRTPMPWTREPGVGFTSSVPWEPLHADSLTANVQAHEDDPGSLLNHYRRLIRLRTATTALTRGDFLALGASHNAVLAYLRRASERTVLVVANLGEEPVTAVDLAAAAGALPAGQWTLTPQLGDGDTVSVRVRDDGSIRGSFTIPAIEPLETRVYALTRSP